MQEQDVKAVFNPVIKAYKKSLTDKDKKPVYFPTYNVAVKMADDIAVHAEVGDFPASLFKAKAPNEDPAQWDYRKNNFRHTTGRVWSRMSAELHRIWNEQNYVIEWPEQKEGATETQSEYFENEYPRYKSLLNYFQLLVTNKKINDPNAVLVIEPGIIPTIEQDGEIVVKDNEYLSPVASMYGCARVMAYEDSRYCLILSPETTVVQYGGRAENTGLVYFLFDDQQIWRIYQVKDKKDYEFVIEVYYTHSLGYLPAWKLEGVPVEVDDYIIHKSLYYGAVPCLDEALYDSSTLSISKTAHAFPQRWEYTDECKHMDCGGSGMITAQYGNGTEYRIACPSCKGTGRKSRFSPLGVMQIDMPERLNTADLVHTPPAGYIEPGTDILNFLKQSIEDNIKYAEAMAGINTAEYKQGDTATGRLIDREALIINVQKFSDSIFGLLGKTIKAIGTIRYGDGFEVPTIAKPVNFDLRSESDLTLELSSAKTAGLPEVAVNKLMKEYLSTRFTNNAEMQNRLDLIMATDALATKADVDIISGISVGYIQKWEGTLHKNINIYIDDEIAADPEFLNLEPAEKKKKLIERAKTDTQTDGFKAADILGGMNNGA